MDRTRDGDADTMTQFFAQQQRDILLSQVDPIAEANYDPLDRTDRPDIVAGTTLKLWDDVRLYDFVNARIILQKNGERDAFFTYRFDTGNGGHTIESWPKDAVTDRAPADPNETPMPIIIPPE